MPISFAFCALVATLAVSISSIDTSQAATLVPHRWTNSAKNVVGTAYGRASSKVWFTVAEGILTETYYPRIDIAQVGDNQLLFANIPGVKFLEEKRDFAHSVARTPLQEAPNPRALLRSMWTGKDAAGKPLRIEFYKEIVTDPNAAVVRVRYRFTSLPPEAKIYILHKPAADNDGWGDIGRVMRSEQLTTLVAWDEKARLPAVQAVAVNIPVVKASVGVVGETDGWQDLFQHGKMVHELESNGPSNIALTAELAPLQKQKPEIEIAIAFAPSPERASSLAAASLRVNFNDVSNRFVEGWSQYLNHLNQTGWLNNLSTADRRDALWNAAVIKSHEDKLNPGAIIASLSIPNIPAGEGSGDGKATGGYHLVWPRDLYKSALALLRLGDLQSAKDALGFMARMERFHGSERIMSQNTWVDGTPFWTGEQMDQEAFPVLLAFELRKAGVNLGEDLIAFVDRRIKRLQNSPGYTEQERWEEASGYSPNTLAVMAAALSRVGDKENAKRLLEVALKTTVSRNGPLLNKPYFIRISKTGEPDAGHSIQIANGGPELQEYRVLDGGFLEWLRYFPNPEKYFGSSGRELVETIRNTLDIYDAPEQGIAVMIKGMPVYRRYTADAYGVEKRGGPWPILALERALPTLLGQRPETAFKFIHLVQSLEGQGGLCSEQLDRRARPMPYAASPLVWCHAELVELAYKAISASHQN